MVMLKTCTKCNTEKSADNFYFDKKNDRYFAACKLCCNAQSKAWAAKNKERMAELQRDWAKNNKDSLKRASDRYREKNAEALRKKASEKYHNAPGYKQYLRQLSNEFYARNPDKVNAKANKRRASKLRAIPSWFGEFEEFAVKEAYNLAKLREKVIGGKWHVDHIIPLQGKNVCGLHVPNNLQVIPAEDNLRKSNNFPS